MLQTLQAGRALAAISVAAFHLSITMGVERYGGVPVFQEFTQHGSRGVDFFFVLSGFIILFAHVGDIDKPRAWGEYIYRRFVRLFPIYWLYTAGFVALLALGFGTQADMPTSVADWLTSLDADPLHRRLAAPSGRVDAVSRGRLLRHVLAADPEQAPGHRRLRDRGLRLHRALQLSTARGTHAVQRLHRGLQPVLRARHGRVLALPARRPRRHRSSWPAAASSCSRS